MPRVRTFLGICIVFILSAFILFVLTECSRKTINDGRIVHVPDYIVNNYEVNLHELIGGLSYFSPSSSDSTLIGNIQTLIFSPHQALILEKQTHKLYQFNSEGKYIKEFLKFGKGPDEFFEISSLDINSNNEILILKNGEVIDIRNSDSELINSIKLSITPFLAKWISNSVIALVYPYPSYLYNQGYELTFIDRKGKTLKSFISHSLNETDAGIGSWVILEHNNNEFYYWNRLSDTVYTINSNLEVYPRMVFTHDERHMPLELMKTTNRRPDLSGRYIIESYHEWGSYIFLAGIIDRKAFRVLIDTQTGNGGNVILDYNKYNYKGIANSIDGGVPFWPWKINYDGKMLMIVDPMELYETFNYNKGKIILPDSLNNKILKSTIENLNMMSNPFIVYNL